jgi:transcriptional regulator GlxA family with amidase domain
MIRPVGGLFLCCALLSSATAAKARPLVAVLAQNDGTEVTDFLVPYGVIASAGVADVIAVSAEEGPVELWPGLRLVADTTIARFDQTHPDGADFVIVPAFHDSENQATRSWLRAQASKGGTLASICDGALALAGTGLLDGRRATGHFYSADQRRRDFPNVNWVANTRFVHDGKFISSSGVSASLPTALYVVEMLAGRDRALAVARARGLSDYGAEHDSDAFRVGLREYWIGAKAMLFGWPRDVYAIELEHGVDEVGLAFAVDMLSRTYRSKAIAAAPSEEVTTRNGLRVLRETSPAELPPRVVRVRIGGPASDGALSIGEGGQAPRDVLAHLTRRHGEELSAFVAMQLEYPPPPADHAQSR